MKLGLFMESNTELKSQRRPVFIRQSLAASHRYLAAVADYLPIFSTGLTVVPFFESSKASLICSGA